MISLLKRNFNFFSIIINLFTLSRIGAILQDYDVKVETITRATSSADAHWYFRKDHPMSKLSNEERMQLCKEAKQYVFPDEPNDIQYAYEPDILWMTYSDFTGINSIAIRCLTHPHELYLRFGTSMTELWIMKEDGSFRPPPLPKTIDDFELQVQSTGYLDVRSMNSYGAWPYNRDHFLVKLSKEELSKLCLRVKRHASLDGIDSEIESSYHLVDKMVYPEYVPGKGRSVYYIGMSCKTIPRSWLRLTDDTGKRITIMIQDWDVYQNGDYTFEIRSVKSHQGRRKQARKIAACEDDILLVPGGMQIIHYNLTKLYENTAVSKRRKYDDKLDGSDDSKYWNSQRLLICFFAGKRIKELMLISEGPALADNQTEEHAMYDIDLPVSVEKHIAFACPSSPRMYAYFDTSVDRHIVALLVKESTTLHI